MTRMRPVKLKDFVKVLSFLGYEQKRTKGDHIIYQKPGVIRPIVIVQDKEISKSIVRNNLKSMGITKEYFYKLLEKLK